MFSFFFFLKYYGTLSQTGTEVRKSAAPKILETQGAAETGLGAWTEGGRAKDVRCGIFTHMEGHEEDDPPGVEERTSCYVPFMALFGRRGNKMGDAERQKSRKNVLLWFEVMKKLSLDRGEAWHVVQDAKKSFLSKDKIDPARREAYFALARWDEFFSEELVGLEKMMHGLAPGSKKILSIIEKILLVPIADNPDSNSSSPESKKYQFIGDSETFERIRRKVGTKSTRQVSATKKLAEYQFYSLLLRLILWPDLMRSQTREAERVRKALQPKPGSPRVPCADDDKAGPGGRTSLELIANPGSLAHMVAKGACRRVDEVAVARGPAGEEMEMKSSEERFLAADFGEEALKQFFGAWFEHKMAMMGRNGMMGFRLRSWYHTRLSWVMLT